MERIPGAPDFSGKRVAGRYLCERLIGRGGMAVVYAAHDSVSDSRVALKLLITEDKGAEQARRSRELFYREYHALSHFDHPRIVAVRDFGLDHERPYYAMELLDGGDLLELSPLPWAQACAIAYDVCSALSLLHSRHAVYRDLSARNIRCTSDGKAKLIDFGALIPMGHAQADAVCTPAVAAPEVVYGQPVDGRADLYALGVTLYATLVGFVPYPARSFRQLPALWRNSPAPPSSLVASIPPALDALVMDLLQLDPRARPASVVEVAQRLSAIAKLQRDERLLVSRAHLTMPTLVAREAQLGQVISGIERASEERRGSALLIRGAAGVGRSRLLEASALEAQLRGFTVLRVAGQELLPDTDALSRSLLQQLLVQRREGFERAAAPDGQVLARLLPELAPVLMLSPQADQEAGVELRVKAAVRRLLLRLSESTPLLIAADDIDALDADSRALLSLLAHDTARMPLLLLTTLDAARALDDTTEPLAAASTELHLSRLTREQTHELFESVFGEVPNLGRLVLHFDEVAEGNPRDLMRLAQHLIDRDAIRRIDGAFVLPEDFNAAGLPGSMAQALTLSVAGLDADAGALAQTLALCPDQHFDVRECQALSEHGDLGRVYRSLDRLVSASIVARRAEFYGLESELWVQPLSGAAGPEMHTRLAEVFARRDDAVRAARHALLAGREDAAVELLVEHATRHHDDISTSQQRYFDFLRALPSDWSQIYRMGIELAQAQGRSGRAVQALRFRLGGVHSQSDGCSYGVQAELANEYAHDAGLDLYAGLDDSMPTGERLRTALEQATVRYQKTPEHERKLDPTRAIGRLARITISAIGEFSRNLDVDQWRQMPSLEPLLPLSPAIAVAHQLSLGFDARVSGRFEEACAIYRKTLAQLEDSGGAGLEPAFSDGVRAALPSIIGMMEAALGLPSCQQLAAQVEGAPLYHGSALAIRMLWQLFLGNVEAAERASAERELWRLEQPHRTSSDSVTLLWALLAHAGADDLTGVRHDQEAIARVAARVPTWEPMALWARGEYERIRGDHDAALQALDQALALLPAAMHQVWPFAAGARLKVLLSQERYGQVCTDAERDLELAENAGLGHATSFLRMPYAEALAWLGHAQRAREQAQRCVECLETLGAQGLLLGLTHEAAARVARRLGDLQGFEHHSGACEAEFLAYPNPALASKYRRLTGDWSHKDAAEVDAAVELPPAPDQAQATIESALHECQDAPSRLRRALELLVLSCDAEGGYLFSIAEDTLTPCAQTEEGQVPADIEAQAREYLTRELEPESVTADATGSLSEDEPHWMTSNGQRGQVVVLSHGDQAQRVISGVAVLLMAPGPSPVVDWITSEYLSRVMVEAGDLHATVVGDSLGA
ncbi:MAG: serine/threonine protein kinase [Myxococcales bacterium]|nr:serine/threonine protein kinase [Myxococcales bacterium]